MEIYRQSRPFHRLIRRMAATRLMARIYAVIQTPLDRLVYRLTHGSTTASSWLGGVEITMLNTTGAKTGSTRTSPVLCIPDGEHSILIASNYGRPHNPSWYYNLRAHPYATIVTADTSSEVVAEELSGDDRERSYRRGEEIYPGFTHYPRWTAGRRIPVFRLKPRGAGHGL
jgi:deazaflavin-dependent oxidoreductase (nitroreductase family)